MFFTYTQNNGGGSFVKPALHFIVEAKTAEEANDIAEEYIYFDGCDKERDCECCGDRWEDRWDRQWDESEGSEEPEIYGKPASEYKDEYGWAKMGKVEIYKVVYKND